MNKLSIALIIAQNGLRTAASLLSANAAKDEATAGKAKNKAEAEKLRKGAERTKKLAQILTAADAGVSAYLAEA